MTANAGPLLIEVIVAMRRGEILRYGFNRGAPRWWLSPSGQGVDPAVATAAVEQPDIQSAGGSLFPQQVWGQAWRYRGPIQQKPGRTGSEPG
jgi:hypothetical protein